MQVRNVLHAAPRKIQDPKIAKNYRLGTIPQICRAISSQLRHVSTVGKNAKQQYLPLMSLQFGEHFGPLAALSKLRATVIYLQFQIQVCFCLAIVSP